jgi:hypothetical protein
MMVLLLYHITGEKKHEAWQEKREVYFFFCRKALFLTAAVLCDTE